ncbi:MAG: HEAT repeat domain-containing protein [Nitrosarchaeum sp.]|nr:HEAT repeat domain-containing protein [Nitrosarchaeum sp.]
MVEMYYSLNSGTEDEKITILESLRDADNVETIKKIIAKLDDESIQVRGEAFSSLILNKNDISDVLIENLNSENKNIRAYTALVLANRNEINAIPKIMKLTNDERSIVRSCALGALGHLKAKQSVGVIEHCLTDSNLEVKKSAVHAAIFTDFKLSKEKIREISEKSDPELDRLLLRIKNGPEGI